MSRLGYTTTLVAAFLLGGGDAAAAQAAAPDSSQLAAGKKLYLSKGLCFSCHGAQGEGLLGPTTQLVARPFVHTNGGVAELVALIKAGITADRSRSKQVMPPRGGSRLTDREIELVAVYVKHLNGQKAPPKIDEG